MRGIIGNVALSKKKKSRKSSLSSPADVEMIDTSSTKPKKLPVVQEEDHTLELDSQKEEQVADDASKKKEDEVP